ncbi:MAG: 2-phospho-L-lactate transferase [Alphaproteobacteria bacterium]|nr:2-phospho-L-lactate transferase [Alphaproteobacteria bacterium]
MTAGRVVALAGGVGGARLADGLARLLGERLMAIVNTGDDFEHLGLHVSPDLDTVMYTLAGLADPAQGWGLAGESWTFMEQVARLGGPTWFRLGDRDLATNALRTGRLRAGDGLGTITADLSRALGIAARIVPMSDDPVRTLVHSGSETHAFQDYFVRLRCEVPVNGFTYQGAVTARMHPAIAALGGDAAPAAVVICPSNPYLSIGPILAVPGLRALVSGLRVPVIAVSPIVGGAAIKGPAAKIMQELGLEASAAAIARHYRGLIDGLVIDNSDAALRGAIEADGVRVLVTPTVMRSTEDRVQLARECLDFAAAVAAERRAP